MKKHDNGIQITDNLKFNALNRISSKSIDIHGLSALTMRLDFARKRQMLGVEKSSYCSISRGERDA